MNLPLIAGSAFAIFGLYISKHAIANYKNAVASQAWPDVEGRLTDVRLWGKRNVGGVMKEVEKLNVEYQYEINDLEYTGTSATFYMMVYPETVEFAERHSANTGIKVYYNPKDPSESVLIPGPRQAKPYSDLILGFLSIAMGVVIAFLGGMGLIG